MRWHTSGWPSRLVLAVLAGWTACAAEDSQPADDTPIVVSPLGGVGVYGATSGAIRVAIIDAKTEEDVAEVWIAVAGVSVKPCESAWVEYAVEPPVSFDLAAQVDGAFASVFEATDLAAGTYCGLRVIFAESPARVVLADGTERALNTTRAETSGAVFDGTFEIRPEPYATTVTLDIQLPDSLVQRGNGAFNLLPHLGATQVTYGFDGPLLAGTYEGASTFEVGPEGGEVELPTQTLVFPPGAVDAPTRFNAVRMAHEADLYAADSYIFSPSTVFETLVTSRVELYTGALGADVVVTLDGVTMPSRVEGTTVVTTLPHFSVENVLRVGGQGVEPAYAGEWRLLSAPDAVRHIASTEASMAAAACSSLSTPLPDKQCLNDPNLGGGLSIDCDGDKFGRLSPNCVQLEAEYSGAEAIVRLSLAFDAHDLERLQASDATLEIKINGFQTADHQTAFIEWTQYRTDLPGAVADSNCLGPFEEPHPRATAVTVLCPTSLVAGRRYKLEFKAQTPENVADLPEDARSFSVSLYPGRLCNDFEYPFGFNRTVDGYCAGVMAVDGSAGHPTNGHAVWSCLGDFPTTVVGGYLRTQQEAEWVNGLEPEPKPVKITIAADGDGKVPYISLRHCSVDPDCPCDQVCRDSWNEHGEIEKICISFDSVWPLPYCQDDGDCPSGSRCGVGRLDDQTVTVCRPTHCTRRADYGVCDEVQTTAPSDGDVTVSPAFLIGICGGDCSGLRVSWGYLEPSSFYPSPDGAHPGVDVVGWGPNDVVRATAPGTVVAADDGYGCGRLVIRDVCGRTHVYLHNASLLVGLGQTVEAGDPIAIPGRRDGYGCIVIGDVERILHYEVRDNYGGLYAVGATSCSGCATADLTVDPVSYSCP